jgi:hypothetical protein
MKESGAILKVLGWALMAGLPGSLLLFAGYVYITSPGDRASLISYAGVVLAVIVVSGFPGLLVLLLGHAFTGPKTEGSLGEPHS